MTRNISSNRMRRRVRIGAAAAGLITLMGCSDPPSPQLLLLSSGPTPMPGQRALLSSNGNQSGLDVRSRSTTGAQAAAVAVTVPQYLDRPEIMVRTDAIELKPLPNSRWAEDLAVTASRTLAEDLNRILPGYEIVAWPDRFERAAGHRIEVNLSHFEMNSPNQVVIAGRWVITDDAAGKQRASANFQSSALVAAADPKLIVETMSGLLGNVSSEIAVELQRQQTVGRR